MEVGIEREQRVDDEKMKKRKRHTIYVESYLKVFKSKCISSYEVCTHTKWQPYFKCVTSLIWTMKNRNDCRNYECYYYYILKTHDKWQNCECFLASQSIFVCKFFELFPYYYLYKYVLSWINRNAIIKLNKIYKTAIKWTMVECKWKTKRRNKKWVQPNKSKENSLCFTLLLYSLYIYIENSLLNMLSFRFRSHSKEWTKKHTSPCETETTKANYFI